jgi:hypothetical protein
MTRAFNAATENGLHCFQGAGNEGHDSDPTTWNLLIPADALQVVTVGAVDSSGTIASFSSEGPTADGRLKPEVLTRGVDTFTVHADDDHASVQMSGTSMSTPLAAAAAACLVQAHPEWTVAQLRAALTRTASDYVANGIPDPLFVRGYGIIDATEASGHDDPLVYCDAKKNTADCVPSIGAHGIPSASSPEAFEISAELVLNNKNGLFFYGAGGTAEIPFFGGLLCVGAPLRRTLLQSSGGNPPPADCSGRLSFDFNEWLRSGSDSGLVPGVVVNAQFWFRDPADPHRVGLTDGIQFTIRP